MTKLRKKGFTLVEIAIVLTIIGLLIGGILKGEEMIVTAQVNRTIADVNGIRAAAQAFRDKYSQIPGDMVTAVKTLPGCTPENFCIDGNGDSIVGTSGWIGTDGPPVQNQGGITTLPQAETTQYWKHLSLADMISGVSPNADPSDPSWGETHPSAASGGGFTIATKTTGPVEGSPNGFPNGILLRQVLSPLSSGTTAEVQASGGGISPRTAARIDRKMDDGSPRTGYVAGEHVTSGCMTLIVAGEERYNEDSRKDSCVLYYRF